MTYNILFKKFFVEPILSGQKTQTRRVEKQYVKPGDHLLARTAYFEKPFARLKVKAVRRERLWRIDIRDYIAEGTWKPTGLPDEDDSAVLDEMAARALFSGVWNSINNKPGHRWEDNPEVTVIEFGVVRTLKANKPKLSSSQRGRRRRRRLS